MTVNERKRRTLELYNNGCTPINHKDNFVCVYMRNTSCYEKVKDFMTEIELESELNLVLVKAVKSYHCGKKKIKHTAKITTYMWSAFKNCIDELIEAHVNDTKISEFPKDFDLPTLHVMQNLMQDYYSIKHIFYKAKLNSQEVQVICLNIIANYTLRGVARITKMNVKLVAYYKSTAIKKLKAYYTH